MSVESVSIQQRLLWIINLIFHQAVAVITVYILSVIFTHHDINQLFTWHAVLCTLGFMLLTTEGLILWNKSNIPTLFISKSDKLLFHIVLLASGTGCVIVGIALEIYNKSSHFTTVHGVLGLITLILIILVALLGIAASQAQYLKNVVKPVVLKFLHNCLGVITLIIGITTLYLGLLKKSFADFTNDDTVIVATVVMYLLVLWSCLDAFQSMYYQIKLVFSL